jgi:hypothetical protein
MLNLCTQCSQVHGYTIDFQNIKFNARPRIYAFPLFMPVIRRPTSTCDAPPRRAACCWLGKLRVRRPIIKSVSVCEIPDSDRATTAMFRSSARAPAALRRRRGLVGAGGAVPTGYCARHSYALLLMSRTLCLGQTQRSPIGIGNGAVTTLLLAVMDGEQWAHERLHLRNRPPSQRSIMANTETNFHVQKLTGKHHTTTMIKFWHLC